MERFDLLVIGGGINGAAIARDAAGRGCSVLLVEKDDLAAHTSSASSKLIHGGLRYLEQRDFRLVRESLQEREILLNNAPHIVRPLQFVLPDPPGGRPWWMIRLGLWMYDLLAGRSSLKRLKRLEPVRKDDDGIGGPLKPDRFRLATYWDAWVDDSRLVVLNAMDAAERGAEIATRTAILSARREGEIWKAKLSDGREVGAGAIVNAAGPWVDEVAGRLGHPGQSPLRLVKGSHIVVPRLWAGEQAYILQQPDLRVVFALPFEGMTLIGTTDIAVEGPDQAQISAAEIAYLCACANAFFQRQIRDTDVIWSYSGIRSLFDDGSLEARKVTRDYRLEVDPSPGGRLLTVVGGKITTARALASEVMDRLRISGLKFTRTSPLPGGDITPEYNQWLDSLSAWLPPDLLKRLATSYGTRLERMLGGARSMADLGRDFGAGLHEAELRYLVDQEFARSADDILWRRTKLGLRFTDRQRRDLERALPKMRDQA